MPKAKETKPAEQPEEVVIAEEVIVEKPDGEVEAIEAVEETAEEPKLAKAGKRSAKAVKEAEELAEKEDRKAKIASGEIENPAEIKKGPTPITRPKSERRSKKYKEAAKQVDQTKDYAPDQALSLAKKTSTTKFDGSVEVHLRLGVDPRHADQNIRGTVSLPAGTGKDVKVAVFASADLHKAAKEAGADAVYDDELLDKLKKEEIDFDVLISTPTNMPKLAKFARVLGPKGLMPSPKSGTVSADPAAAVKDAKAGKIEFRVDKQGIINAAIGKVSFSEKDLASNYQAFMQAIKDAKPASVKGTYIKSIYVNSTMSPSIRVEN